MTKIEWTRSAISDVKSLKDYIARDSEAYADRFVQKIIEVVEKAGAFPHMGRQVAEANERRRSGNPLWELSNGLSRRRVAGLGIDGDSRRPRSF